MSHPVTLHRWPASCSPFQTSSQEAGIYLLKPLALKGHKISKEKLQFAQTLVQYLGHLISQGQQLDPGNIEASWTSPNLSTNYEASLEWRATVELGFQTSLTAQPLCFTKKQQTWPYCLEGSQPGWHGLCDVKEKPNKAPCPSYQLAIFLPVCRAKRVSSVHSPKSTGPSLIHGVSQPTSGLWGWGIPPCIRAFAATALLVKAAEE